MWKFKNRRKPSEELLTEPTTTIIETQVVDISVGDGDGDGDGMEQNNKDHDTNNNEQDNNEYTSNKNIETVDALLAKELNSLSFQQRESINEEIHGINVNQIYFDKVKEIEETPDLLKESFTQLELELQQLQVNSFAYTRCQQLYGCINYRILGNKNDGRTYINSDEFRIMFLRCEFFDVIKAARRLICWVELSYRLFGDVGIQRRIQLCDMSETERRILEGGYMQILPGRDRAGRRALFVVASNRKMEYKAESRLRILMYTQLSIADDIETQQKGHLLITWYHNVNIFENLSARAKVHSAASNANPLRVGALHVCIPEELEKDYGNMPVISKVHSLISSSKQNVPSPSVTHANIIKSMIALSVSAKYRSKLRFHTGSAMECLYALQSFGIPSSQIPLVIGITSNKKRRRKETKRNKDVDENNNNNDCNLKLDNHIKWLKLCQLKESNIKSYGKNWKCYNENYHGNDGHKQVIECPNHSDILSGRGYSIYKYPGNAVFRNVVASKLDEYIHLKSHPYSETTKLTLNVVHLLKNKYGARFLKEETTESKGNLGCWIEVSDEEARMKVRIAFRDKIKKQQPNKQTQPQHKQQSQMLQPSVFVPKSSSLSDDKNKAATVTATNNNVATAKVDDHSSSAFSFDNNKRINDDHSSSTSSLDGNQRTNNDDDDDKTSNFITSHTRSARSSRVRLPLHNVLVSSSTSQSTTISSNIDRQENNNNISHRHQQIQQQQQEGTDSSTSMFLSMTDVGIGIDSGCCTGCGNGSGSGNWRSNSSGKKRQLQNKLCFNCFDHQLRSDCYNK